MELSAFRPRTSLVTRTSNIERPRFPVIDAFKAVYPERYVVYGGVAWEAWPTHDPPRQGRWYASGLHLPDDVLERVYYRNAERLLLRRP